MDIPNSLIVEEGLDISLAYVSLVVFSSATSKFASKFFPRFPREHVPEVSLVSIPLLKDPLAVMSSLEVTFLEWLLSLRP